MPPKGWRKFPDKRSIKAKPRKKRAPKNGVAASPVEWRVERPTDAQQALRTILDGDKIVGVMYSDELACKVVNAVNFTNIVAHAYEKAPPTE